MNRLEEVQAELSRENIDGWLFFDHHRRDPFAYRILGISADAVVTRRWYYLIPAHGRPRALVHRIEAGVLDRLPGERAVYSTWKEQHEELAKMVAGMRSVAMQYSAMCAIPYVAMVDAGTVELVRSFGAEVVSSADLVQQFEARWSQRSLELHIEAGLKVDAIRSAAFRLAGERLRSGSRVGEYDLKSFILESFAREALVTDHGPIVAVNANASNPHYEPDITHNAELRRGDCLLIDLWAKVNDPDAVYYDSTWVGFAGDAVPAPKADVFEVVRTARDRAIDFVQQRVRAGTEVRGFEVDRAARTYIVEAGYGDYFIHRTGHSIGAEVHGAGANMDDFESHDFRRIVPYTCFSVEPGVYLAEFGIRSEVDVFVGETDATVTGEIQRAVVLL